MMNRNFRKLIVAGAFLVFTTTGAFAQRDWDHYHQDRDDRWRGDAWRMRLFTQVREDLDHVQFATWGPRDRYRIGRTKEELNEMQDKLSRGVYDERELDDVIGALRRVVADNHMAPRDRDMLNEDLRRLAEYREHHEQWRRDYDRH
ncbi:MAG: hypothetical protein JO022_15955 [Acidobacteriaceae bacterium]|nr:hypothetical protein [Acidobacteriaceae bacterium]